jgi:hypothetical protein
MGTQLGVAKNVNIVVVKLQHGRSRTGWRTKLSSGVNTANSINKNDIMTRGIKGKAVVKFSWGIHKKDPDFDQRLADVFRREIEGIVNLDVSVIVAAGNYYSRIPTSERVPVMFSGTSSAPPKVAALAAYLMGLPGGSDRSASQIENLAWSRYANRVATFTHPSLSHETLDIKG